MELAERIEAAVDRLPAAGLDELPELLEALAAAGQKPFPEIREIVRLKGRAGRRPRTNSDCGSRREAGERR